MGSCRIPRVGFLVALAWPSASCFPYNPKLCINGHEYAKRQLEQQSIAYEALDNGILSCQDPGRLQALCDGLSAGKIEALLRKWLCLLPYPFSACDRQTGYRYDLSILQIELSLTQVLDRPVAGRIFYEEVIRENLDIGRPKSLEMAAALNPTYASAYTLLGQTYGRLGETAKSQAAFQKSRSLQEKEIQDMHDKLPSEQELSEQPSPKNCPLILRDGFWRQA
jgi:tetratricopeptide (TPR) repeat protein